MVIDQYIVLARLLEDKVEPALPRDGDLEEEKVP
jgi:hypothetical protein